MRDLTTQQKLPVFKTKKQRTLKREVSLTGVGVFTGATVKISLHPAPGDHGIIFERSDLPNKPRIPAKVEFVQKTPRCTILGDGDISIQTVEHVLAALKAYQIDNVLIEIHGPEVPIFDGSAISFIEAIEQAGIDIQDAEKKIITLSAPLFWSEGEVQIIALPSDEYRISYTLHYPHSPLLRSQYHSFVVEEESFKREIAPSRTFSLYEEIAPLIEKGLVKGGSLKNAVIIKENQVVNPEGLRFQDEMVRHKILDLIGDLSLVDVPFKAHIIAIRSGHSSNNAFAKELVKHLKNMDQQSSSKNSDREMSKPKEGKFMQEAHNSSHPIKLDVKRIAEILPHRYPFLLVDRIIHLDLEGNVIIGQKNVTANEQFFQGHFPGVPIMPGVLVLEALAQTGGILVHQKGHNQKIAVLLNVNNAKFRKPVVPGDVLTLHAVGLHLSSKGGRIQARAMVNDQLAVEAEIGFALVHKEQL